MNEGEKPVAADDVDLSNVNKIFHTSIHDVLPKHENLGNGRLGHLKIPKQAIDVGEAKPSERALYHSGPTAKKTRSIQI